MRPVVASAILCVVVLAAWTRAASETIVLARDASASEATAADELSRYLGRAVGRSIPVLEEGAPTPAGHAFYVGATARARSLGIRPELLGPEEWILRGAGEDLVLCGGAPRGTLYAVFHYLEDEVGVRWWNQFEEEVPRLRSVPCPKLNRRGRPAFAYREINRLDGPALFNARNRLSGGLMRIPWAWGGHWRFATPWQAHGFFNLVPPDVWFDSHPEYFSERAGLRWGGESQLCLSNPVVADVMAAKLIEIGEHVQAESRAAGEAPPELYDVSHNDWGGWCRCSACNAIRAKEGADSGTLLQAVNRAAALFAEKFPAAWVTTLAYTYTFLPPATVRPRENVIVEVSGWGKRDFARPADDPANGYFRDTVQAWGRIAPRFWVWDYAFTMASDEFGLPFPNQRFFARDLRCYRDAGASGVIMQVDTEVTGDFRDLKVWMLTKLMEDPDRDALRLEREFVSGYYGPAAPAIRRYLALLNRTTKTPPPLAAETTLARYGYLDLRFVLSAESIFDDALRRAGQDAIIGRRVRHARMSTDYAVLARWGDLVREHVNSGAPRSSFLLDRKAVESRYLAAAREQVELCYAPAAWERVYDPIADAVDDLRP